MWLELRISAEYVSEEAFISLTTNLDCLGTAEETEVDSGHTFFAGWFASGEDVRQTRARITAACLLWGLPSEAIHLSTIDSEWETAWQQDWRAMPVGRHLWVRPSFCAPPEDGRIDIVLDPGMAFGTGQHATTRLCLVAIERLCESASVGHMLDMGCGSALLAIAAAKLGVKVVRAIDNDTVAIEAAERNTCANHVNVQCCCARVPPDGKFDLVVANILAGPLIDMAGSLAACTGRFLVLSGLLENQMGDVRRAYAHHGLQHIRTDTDQEWVAMECGR